MKPLSWTAVVLVIVLTGLSAWARGNPYDIGGTFGRTVGVLLIPFLIAYLVRGRKRKWDSFARWFFWLGLIAAVLANTRPA